MRAATRSPQSRPDSAPAYLLARSAGLWIIALHRQTSADPGRPARKWHLSEPRRAALKDRQEFPR
jgi:hypothetical protein